MPRPVLPTLVAIPLICAACGPGLRPAPASGAKAVATSRGVAPTRGTDALGPRVRAALTAVSARLRSAEIRAVLRARRRHNLDVLHAYWVAGRFPVNTTVLGEGHFLMDGHGHFCAVANLIVKDGHRDLVEAASRKNNALLFGDVTSGPLYKWILTSGFTQQEIARIQVPAPYSGPTPGPRLQQRWQRKERLVAKRQAARRKVRAYLRRVETALRADEAAGLATATARLSGRPALVAALLDHTGGPAGRTEVADATGAARFAAPPR